MIDLFLDCLTLDARKNLGITERFYTNGLENQHKLQKRSIKEAGIHKEVVAVSKQLKEWSDDYFREAERALYECGRYRLSDEYKGFERKLLTWNKMNVREREKLLKAYFHYVPGDKMYKKPVSSGLKPSNSGKNKRRV